MNHAYVGASYESPMSQVFHVSCVFHMFHCAMTIVQL